METKLLNQFAKKFSFSRPRLDNIIADSQAAVYLINKPKNHHSFRAVSSLRQVLKIKKVGFAGTLDPLASGLLILATGQATKLLDCFHTLPKTYLAEIEFGKTSDTYDLEGKIKINQSAKKFSQADLKSVLEKFIGQQLQTVPLYSAKKIGGQKLHQLARRGQAVKLPRNQIEIYSLKIKKFQYPQLVLEVECSTGTYIRSLAADLGQTLGSGAILTDLQRRSIGNFNIANALPLEKINPQTLSQCRLSLVEVIGFLNQ